MWYLVICQEHFSLYWTFVVTKENVKFYIYIYNISIYVNIREQFSKCSRFCQSHGSKQGDSIMHLQWSTDKWAPCTAMTLYISEISCGFPSFKQILGILSLPKTFTTTVKGYRKPWYFTGKAMVSFRFSLKPIHWHRYFWLFGSLRLLGANRPHGQWRWSTATSSGTAKNP